MTSIEVYKKFQLKFDKLETQDAVDISPGEFVLMYNELQNKFIKSETRNRSTRYVDDLEGLIILNKELEYQGNKDEHSDFKLPENYFDYIGSYAKASNGDCKNRKVFIHEVKMADLNSVLSDEYYSPSFEYEETVGTLSSNLLNVYFKDFKIDKVFLTYYRKPVQIDIEGYIKLDGTDSQNIDPEFSDLIIDQIIDLCVAEASRNYDEYFKYQTSQARIAENKQ